MYIATHDKDFFPVHFAEKFKCIKGLGFDAFEIDGKVLVENHREIETAAQRQDLPVQMVCGGYGGWIGDFSEERRQKGLADIKEILSIAGKMGICGIVVPAAWGMFSLRLPPMTPPRTREEDREILLDSLAELEESAAKTNTTIYLEPINRYQNHMIVTVEDAYTLIQAGGFQHVKICADFYHMNIEEAHIHETLQTYSSLIGHIHIASNQRFQPGIGHMDYVSSFAVLKAANYSGGAAMECRIIGDGMQALEQSVQFMRETLKKAGF